MLRYNKAVEYLQMRFADAMNSMDPRFDTDAVESIMSRDQFLPAVDKFLIGSPKVPVLFLLVSDQLWAAPHADTEDGREDGEDELTHLDKVMFASKVTNVTGVAAIVYAARVPNPRTSAVMDSSPSGKGDTTSSQLVDVTSEVMFGVLQNDPVAEFITIARDVLIPIGVQCHQLILQEYRGSDFQQKTLGEEGDGAAGRRDPTVGAIPDTILTSKTLRPLIGYNSERGRERVAAEVEEFYRNARAAVDHIERLDKEKHKLVSFEVEDPTRILRRVQATPNGIDRAANDAAVVSLVKTNFVRWINYARMWGDRDAVSGFYPVCNNRGVSMAQTAQGAQLVPSGAPSRAVSQAATPAQPSIVHPSMQSAQTQLLSAAAHMRAQDPDVDLVIGDDLTLVPLSPPRQYNFQLVPESFGPLSEVSHWRSFELHAQHLCDSAASRDVQTLAMILGKCHPQLHRVWVQTTEALRRNSDEAAAVVKYLKSVSRRFDALYGADPEVGMASVREVVQTLTVIHNVVPYYREGTHIQQLVQSVAHQIILCCKQSIRSLGRVWEQSESTLQLRKLLKKFADSTALCRSFQDHLTETEMFPLLDELCVFGKLELFCSRLHKLTNLFSVVLVFLTLQEYHMGDGIAPILQTFFATFEDLRRKSGDSLEYTKPSFDKDYLDFVTKVADVDCSLQVYVNSCFEDVPNTLAALELLKKFSLLVTRPTLRADLQAKYFLLFQRFGTELEAVQRTYEQHKADPPILRNATPVAGRVLWVRQLLARIEAPMRVFQSSHAMVSHQRDTTKIIRLYNRVALALTEYEAYWLQTWRKAVEVAGDGLKATLLVREEARGGPTYIVNLDPTVTLMARETQWLLSLGVEVPHCATELVRMKSSSYAVALRHCLTSLRSTEASIKQLHGPALAALVSHVHGILKPATQTLTWNSTLVAPFLGSLKTAVDSLASIVMRVNAMEENLICEPIEKIKRDLLLCAKYASAVPSSTRGDTAASDDIAEINDDISDATDATVSLEVFVETVKENTTAASGMFSTNNKIVRDAVIDLCGLIDKSWTPCDDPQTESQQHLSALYVKYNRLLFKAVLHTTLRSLRHFHDFASGRLPYSVVRLEAILSPPHLFVSPALEEVQLAVQLCVRMLLQSTQSTGNWPNVRGAYSCEASAPFFDEIHRNKNVVKEILLFSAAMLDARRQVDDFLKSLLTFRGVWQQNPTDVVNTFVDAAGRRVEDYLYEIQFCTKLHLQVQLIPDCARIACFSVNCVNLKGALTSLINKWLEKYGAALHSHLDKKLSRLLDRTDTILKGVAHEPVADIHSIDSELSALDITYASEVDIDMELAAVREACTTILEHYHLGEPNELMDRAADIAVKWRKVSSLASAKREALVEVQLPLRHELNDAIRRFGVEILCFRNDFEANGPLVPGIKPDDAIEKLRRFQRSLEDRLRTWQMHYNAELRFGCTPHTYPELARTVQDVYMADQLYSLYTAVQTRIDAMGSVLWRSVKYDELVAELLSFQQSIKRLPAQVRVYEAFDSMRANVDRLLEMQPILEQLGHRSVRERHWQQVMKICGASWSIDKDSFVLSTVWAANLVPFKDDIMELAMASEKEGELEAKLQSVIREWKDKELTFAEYKHRGFILLKADDTAALKESLEEALVVLGSMLASKYVAPFRHETAGWTTRLAGVGETIVLWLEVQSLWMYLEAVFSSGDIVKQLPHDAKRFSMIDRQWVKLFFRAAESPNLLEFSVSNEIKNLPYFKDQLDLCQRALAQYLESKRNAFARFYFVSDAVLLEVLAQGSDPTAMQPHFSAIFDGVHSVQLEPSVDKKAWRVKAMQSAEDEVVQLSEVVSCEGSIEEWLTRLEKEMCRSVRIVLREAVGDALSIRTDASLLKRFYMSHFSQAVLTALQILFTTSVTEVLSGPPSLRKDMAKHLSESKETLAEQARGSLSAAARTHIQTLTTIAVHNLEVWEDHAKKAKDPQSFEWQRQLRFYWTERNECVLRIADADIIYCNEYLGVKERLVITPLTDRCYITLSQALAMYMGGAAAGPAGTGKTETVKDLGRAAGKYVVVFNCSDQYDARATAKIFRGLAQSGCWGCLDEFNRITLPVLSVVSQQIHGTFTALKQQQKEFVFADGTPCRLVSTMGVFVTMNPGYAGRQELPENLKVHFRSVSMMVPDRLSIMKTKLAAAGYKLDKPLSQKFFLLYALCEQQLSKQQHYDFGLRNILSVLRTAGDVLRHSGSADEEAVFMRCVRDMNVSKFVHEDVPVFLTLLNDIFAGKVPDRLSLPALEGALRDAAAEASLTITESWMKKCTELYETKKVRHGVMIVGPAGSGKTCCVRALLRALHTTEARHKEVRLNPKALTVAQLFGHLDSGSGDWHDGVFSYLWRRWNKERNLSVWLVCDGPVDTIWIESLNTVLDDNKLLTLANGDRILMSPTFRMCFEVENLNNASPATVSRAGIVYISYEDVGARAVLSSLVDAKVSSKTWPAYVKEPLLAQSCAQLGALYRFTIKTLVSFPGLSLQHCLSMFIDLIHPLVSQLCLQPRDGEHASGWAQTLKMIVTYAALWSIGGSLDDVDRDALSHALLHGKLVNVEAPPKLQSAILSLSKGSEGTADVGEDAMSGSMSMQCSWNAFDFFVDVASCRWLMWRDLLEPWQLRWDINTPTINAANLFVPHVMSVVLHSIMHSHAECNRPVLLTGCAGSSKTVTMQQFLRSMVSEDVVWAKKNISRATTPLLLQRAIEDMCEKRVGSLYGPQRNRRMNLFIDDLAMSDRNEWGDQPTCELLRQLMESEGFYSVDRIGDFKRFADIKYFGAVTTELTQRSGSRKSSGHHTSYVPPRLLRHFAVYHCPTPQEFSLQHIFESVMLSRFDGTHLISVCGALVSATVALFKRCQERLLPTPTTQHYSFNMRDLSRVFLGILACPLSALDSVHRLTTLWQHEVTRVFGDKLSLEDDVQWFRTQLSAAVKESFPSQKYDSATLYFANFVGDKVRDKATGELMEPAKLYTQTSVDAVSQKIRQRIDEFNETRNVRTPPLQLVLFEAAVAHVCRLCRILSSPRGNALCIGLGGSGRQTTARLAAYLQQQPLFQPSVTSEYQILNWMEDLRAQYFLAASQGHCVMLVTDNELKSEDFLELINTSLSSGDVPGLFNADEKETARNIVRPIARKYNRREFEDSEEWLWHYFIQRVQDHLHFVICLSPQGERFQRRVRRFPAMVASCTINYFFSWGREALLQVTSAGLAEGDFLQRCVSATAQVAAALPHVLVDVEGIVRSLSDEYFVMHRLSIGITPAGFLNFLKTYRKVYAEKLAAIHADSKNVRVGLQKLNQAGRDVIAMRKELNTKEAALAVSAAELASLLEQLSEKATTATEKKERVQVATDKIAAEAADVAHRREDAENDLVAAQPALNAAKAALEQITPTDIITLRAMRRPPEMVRRIFDGVCVLLHEPLDDVKMAVSNSGRPRIEDSWASSGRVVCSRPELLDTLLQFNITGKDRLNDETCELLLPYLWQEDFTYERARTASGNIAGLCTWVRAMEVYRRVAKYVAPKIDALHTAEVLLRTANIRLQAQTDELNEAEAQMAECVAQVDTVRADKEALEADTLRTKQRLAYASELIEALADEKRRWEEQELSFNTTIERLVGDAAVASATISFAGPFNADHRVTLAARTARAVHAHRVPFSGRQYNFIRFMTKEETVAQWAADGLPMDTQSIENAIIAASSLLVPCFVDPQRQARDWLNKHLEPKKAVTVKLTAPTLLTTLEKQMFRGRPLLLDEVSFDCDPLLNALLSMRPVKPVSTAYSAQSPTSPQRTFTLDGAATNSSAPELVGYLLGVAYPYDPAFKLYVLPMKNKVDFEPEVYSKVCVLDGSVTVVGLEQQLLGKLIGVEKKELEHERTSVLAQIRTNEHTLRTLESELLLKLSSSAGNLVDDETLILTLQHSKSSAQSVKEQLVAASVASQRIQDARLEYSAVSIRGSLLYFVAAEMARISPAYELSLERMVRLFEDGIHTALPNQVVAQRIANITHTVTQHFFSFVGRGLFERHKVLFALIIAVRVEIQAKRLADADYKLFLTGGTMLDLDELLRVRPKSILWLSNSAWKHVTALEEQSGTFRNLMETIGRYEGAFKSFVENETPELAEVPVYTKLAPFDKLLLVRCLREDRTLNAAVQYVKEVLGPQYMEVPAFSLDHIVTHEASVPRTPVLYLLTSGSDPTAHIEHVARTKKASLLQLSLGQGQEAGAIAALQQCAASGDWVLFQNCHLGVSFLQYLAQWVKATSGSGHGDVADTPEDLPLLPSAATKGRSAASKSSAAKKATQQIPTIDTDNSNFRMFLTAEPIAEFPTDLLLRCLPLTNEPPTGTRATMKKVLNYVQQDVWDLYPHPQWRSCIQALCYYHCVLLERRKHGIYGWTTPYQFTQGDFTAAVFFLQSLFGAMSDDARKSAVSWEAVQFMVGDIHYGGRVTIRQDRLTLQAVTEGIFNGNLAQSRAVLSPALQRFPVLTDINDVVAWRAAVLDQFANNEAPALASLGSNAEVAHRTTLSQAALSSLLSVLPRQSETVEVADGGSELPTSAKKPAASSQEDAALQLAQATLKRLPAVWTEVQLMELAEQRDRLKPLTIFFHLEAQRLNLVIQRTETLLREVVVAITGAAPLTMELMQQVVLLSLGLVPDTLRAGSWSSVSFTSWVSMLLRRYDQISEYLQRGDRPLYDVACLFNVPGFLNSVRQQICRQRGPASGWSLGRAETKLSVTKLNASDVERPADEGAFVTGFYLDGAGWDSVRGRLRPPLSREVYRELPVVLVTAQLQASAPTTSSKKPRAQSPRSDLAAQELAAFGNITQAAFRAHRAQRETDSVVRKAKVPCFTSPLRGDETFVCHVELPHEEADPATWVLRGVALLTSVE